MVKPETIEQTSSMSIRMAGVFAFIGVGLLYLYIALTDASLELKVLWASVLSLGVAFTFLVIWTLACDALREKRLELLRQQKY